jgi:TolA-binding protein
MINSSIPDVGTGIPQDRLETMVAFLKNELNPEEQAIVEQLLEEDATYAAAMESLDKALQKDPNLLEKAIRYREVFSQEVQKQARKQQKSGFDRRLLAVAAVILLLLMPFSFWWYNNQGASNLSAQQLYAQHFEAPMVNGSMRGDSGLSEEAAYIEALDRYGKGQYDAAITAFETYLNQRQGTPITRTDIRAHLYLGISLLEADQPAIAMTHFNAIFDHGDNDLLFDAEYYRAWAYVRLGEIDQAKAVFQQIASKPHRYREAAQRVLKLIE